MKPRAFLDCDVLIDVLARRGEFYAPAAQLLSLCERRVIDTCTSAVALLNVHYVLRRFGTSAKARAALRRVRTLVSVLPVDGTLIDQALGSSFVDLEDAVQYYTARRAGIGFLVTRNVDDYKSADLTVCTPEQYLHILAGGRAADSR